MKGFTLLELVITVVIITIIAVLAIPLITNIAQDRQLIAARKIQAVFNNKNSQFITVALWLAQDKTEDIISDRKNQASGFD